MTNTQRIRFKFIIVLISLIVLACRLPLIHPLPTATATATASPVFKTSPLSATPTPSPTAVIPPNTDTPQLTKEKQVPDISAEDRSRHRRIFQYVWRTVNRRYVYPSFNGVDWNAIRMEFEPLVENASDDAHFWQVMEEMIARLQDEHSAYLTPDEVIEEDQAMRGDLDYVGIGVYVTIPEDAEYAVVLFPMPDGPAEVAGVRAHDRILEIDGLQACCDENGYDSLNAMLGPEGSTVELTLQYPGEEMRQVTIERDRIQTQLPIFTRTITPTIQSTHSVAYVLIPTLWDETIAERTREVLASLLTQSSLIGLIVDMRINGGGAFTELYDLLALFTEGEVGAFYQRQGVVETLDIMPDPVANSQEIPMIVLVGSGTESYAEVFAGVLQAQDRVVLVGESTAGNVETVYPYDLEDGSRLWLAEETFKVPGKNSWEDKGVQPDIHVPGRWEDFTEYDDAALETALSILLAEE
jgi:C-terminal peptidase prc